MVLGAVVAAVAVAAPAHADPDIDFANQLHGYGIYGPRDYNAWLIDFGAAASINLRGSSSNFLGTLHYAAPEVLLGM